MRNKSWTETEKAYYAGICDGEFCVDYHIATPRARINTTDYSLVENLASEYGVSTYTRINKNSLWKDSKQVELHGDNCRDFLQQIRPYLLVKDRQADIILNREDNPEEKIKLLNKTGVNHELREPKDIIWTPERYSYYAGLTDGEGSIYGQIRSNRTPLFVYSIWMCDNGAIAPISRQFCVNLNLWVSRNKARRNSYIVSLYGNNLKSFLLKVQPHLRLKRPQAELVLNCGPTKEEKLVVVERLRELNKTGPRS